MMPGYLIPPGASGQPQQQLSMRDKLMQQIMGQQPQNVGEGAAQLLVGLSQMRDARFPQAPGGARPDFRTRIGNLFGQGMFNRDGSFRGQGGGIL
ncbi:hypothetical protein ACLE20_06945 [Rhizobium sp. YIM 134829]|uniref:hypothetical protein n=1 Tax=Rhizobium sp. YIM 134829 TaxID=3390453 RepID=UPI00397A4B82